MKPHRYKLLYIMNIPSPYRWHLFTQLYEIGQTKGISFEVCFLAKAAPERPWKLTDFPLTFPYRVPWGIDFLKRGTSVRMFNPSLIVRMLFQRWDWVIMGGYDNPSHAVLAALPLPRTTIKIIKNEGNLEAGGISTGIIAGIKRHLLRQSDVYFTVGQRSEKWLEYWVPDFRSKPVHYFPNIIDDRALVISVEQHRANRVHLREKWGIGDRRAFVTPARLSPEKGLLEFIAKLPPDFGEQNVWLIAGEGSLETAIKERLIVHKLNDCVRLVGSIKTVDMPEFYAIGDVFLLPSLSDPNPLSAIEAAFAGLPLLVSTRAGNAPELVINGETGWGFDPTDDVQTRTALHNLLTASPETLNQWGASARERAEVKFNSELVCHQLLDFLLSIHPHRKG